VGHCKGHFRSFRDEICKKEIVIFQNILIRVIFTDNLTLEIINLTFSDISKYKMAKGKKTGKKKTGAKSSSNVFSMFEQQQDLVLTYNWP